MLSKATATNFALLLVTIISLLACFKLTACSGLETGDNLSKDDINYIKSLGLLGNDEKIILFETHAGIWNSIKTSGSFFTEKRIASYWIDNRNRDKTTIKSAYYRDIAAIDTTNLSRDLTSASHLTITQKNGAQFLVFISPNEAQTRKFFNQVINEWHKRTAEKRL